MSQGKPTNQSLTVAQFAEAENISIPTVYKLLREGAIDSYTIGRSRRIPPGQRERLHKKSAN